MQFGPKIFFAVVIPLAVLFLTSLTTGEAGITIGITLLTVVASTYPLFFGWPVARPNPRLGTVLLICGTVCLLTALIVAALLARWSQLGRLEKWHVLPTAEALTWLGFFVGVCLIALGAWAGIGHGVSRVSGFPTTPSPGLPEPPPEGEIPPEAPTEPPIPREPG